MSSKPAGKLPILHGIGAYLKVEGKIQNEF